MLDSALVRIHQPAASGKEGEPEIRLLGVTEEN